MLSAQPPGGASRDGGKPLQCHELFQARRRECNLNSAGGSQDKCRQLRKCLRSFKAISLQGVKAWVFIQSAAVLLLLAVIPAANAAIVSGRLKNAHLGSSLFKASWLFTSQPSATGLRSPAPAVSSFTRTGSVLRLMGLGLQDLPGEHRHCSLCCDLLALLPACTCPETI